MNKVINTIPLATHINKCQSCRKCSLHKRAHKKAPFKGTYHPGKILFVGEAPGKEENMRGQPFVGTAGQFFESILASLGLTREDYAMTNAVLCAPFTGEILEDKIGVPNFREIVACSGNLKRLISLIKPSKIVALGKVADKALTALKIDHYHVHHPMYLIYSKSTGPTDIGYVRYLTALQDIVNA